MPQLEFGTFLPQLVWLAITFVVLYLLMARVALPRVAEVMDERKKRLDHDLEEAARLKRETESAIADYESALASARTKAQAIGAEIRARMAAEAAAQRAKVDAELADRTKAAEASIFAARDAALATLSGVAGSAASDIVTKLTGIAPAQGVVDAAVASAMSRRG